MSDEPNPIIPSPDPSRLTTDAIERVVHQRDALTGAQLSIRDVQLASHSAMTDQLFAAMREALLARIDGLGAQLSERLAGMDKANEVLAANVTRVPTELQSAIEALTRLEDVKFAAIRDQFAERDKQSVREKAAADLAVNAAFAAADKAAAAAAAASTEAIRKSELATAETIKTNAQAQVAGNQSLSDKIEDVKDRMNRIELALSALQTAALTGQSGKDDQLKLAASQFQKTTTLISAIGLILGIITIGVAIFVATGR